MTKQEIWLRLMEASMTAAGEAVKGSRLRVAFEPMTAKIAAAIADKAMEEYFKRFPKAVIGKATRAIAVGDNIYFTDI